MGSAGFVGLLPRAAAAAAATTTPQRRRAVPLRCCLSPLQQGIKSVAVGKHGARPIPEGLVSEIVDELNRLVLEDGFQPPSLEPSQKPESEGRGSDQGQDDEDDDEGEEDLWVEEAFLSPETYKELLHRASFLGALYVKHTLLSHEVELLVKVRQMAAKRRLGPGSEDTEQEDTMRGERGCSPQDLLAVACPRLEKFPELYQVAIRLLKKETLTKDEARALGSVLFAMPAPVVDDDIDLLGGPAFLTKDPALPALDDPSLLQTDSDQILASLDDEDDEDEPGDLGLLDDANQDNTLDPARVLIAHVMRVRHETSEELCGMQEAMMDAIDEPYVEDYDGDVLLSRLRIAHIADPFDGVRHCYMVGPLVARHMQNRWGYNCAVSTVGRSSGPKLPPRSVNARDLIAIGIDAHVIDKNNKGLRKIYQSGKPNPRPCGFVADQAMVAPGLERWVEMRRTIIKRPALAMLEKFLDVTRNASLMILSAFHASVVDKMLDMAENMGVPATIVIYHGLEGSLSAQIHKNGYAVLSCSAKSNKKNQYIRKEFTVTAEDALMPYRVEEARQKLDETELTAEINAELINAYIENGVSGNTIFDKQVRATCVSIDVAMKWIHYNSDIVGWQRWTPLHGVKGLS